MNGEELKARRKKLGIIRRYFANLLGITTEKLYRWETGRAVIPPRIEQIVEKIEERLNKSKNHFA